MLKKSVLILFLKINLMLCGFSQSIRYNNIYFYEDESILASNVYDLDLMNDSIAIIKVWAATNYNFDVIILLKFNVESMEVIEIDVLEYGLRIGPDRKHTSIKLGSKYYSIHNVVPFNNNNKQVGLLLSFNDNLEMLNSNRNYTYGY